MKIFMSKSIRRFAESIKVIIDPITVKGKMHNSRKENDYGHNGRIIKKLQNEVA